MCRVRERPRISTPSAFQEKGGWKIRWPRSPAKNRRFGRSAPSAARNRNCATLTSWASSDNGEVKRRMAAFGKCRSQPAEQARGGDQLSGLQVGAHTLKNGPEPSTL